jgi:hypothetical protein
MTAMRMPSATTPSVILSVRVNLHILEMGKTVKVSNIIYYLSV